MGVSGETLTAADAGSLLGSDAAAAGYGADFVSPELAGAGGIAPADMGGAGVLSGGGAADAATAAAGAAPEAADAGVANPETYGPTTTDMPMKPMGPPSSLAGDQSFWGSMSGGEKAMLAATAFKGIAGLLQPGPTRAQQGLWPGGAYFGMDEKGNGVNLGAVYKNAMTGSDDSTALGGGASEEASATAAQTPLVQQQAPAQLAAGQQAQQQQPQQQGQPTPAASAQTGSSFLPTSGAAAASAQQTTSSQTDSLQKSSQANADFIQSTMDRLDPRKRGND
jgi:hypothetical protein